MALSAIEHYLVEHGYVPHHYEKQKNGDFKHVPYDMTGCFYSTYGPVCISYIKNDVWISYGLGECGFPPHLLTVPRCHRIEDQLKFQGIWTEGGAFATRLMEAYTPAQLEEAIRLNKSL